MVCTDQPNIGTGSSRPTTPVSQPRHPIFIWTETRPRILPISQSLAHTHLPTQQRPTDQRPCSSVVAKLWQLWCPHKTLKPSGTAICQRNHHPRDQVVVVGDGGSKEATRNTIGHHNLDVATHPHVFKKSPTHGLGPSCTVGGPFSLPLVPRRSTRCEQISTGGQQGQQWQYVPESSSLVVIGQKLFTQLHIVASLRVGQHSHLYGSGGGQSTLSFGRQYSDEWQCCIVVRIRLVVYHQYLLCVVQLLFV